MVNISDISFAVRTASQSTSLPIKLSHAQQLVSSALGYKSLASFQASPLESALLEDAAHILLDKNLLDSRIQTLGIQNDPGEVERLIKSAILTYLPKLKFHTSVDSIYNYVIALVDNKVVNDDQTSSQMAMTNGAGIDEIYIPVDEFDLLNLPLSEEDLTFELEGHVSMTIDSERPYSGHMIDIEALLTIYRTGKVSIAEPECKVLKAKLDWNWGNDEDHDDQPTISLEQALSEFLGLKLSEIGKLANAEYQVNQSDDGLVYSYVFHFTDFATPAVAKKIKAKFGSLIVEVPPSFFHGTRFNN